MINNISPKIAIIGAGICGSFLSYLLSTKGFSNIYLFEKKSLPEVLRLGKVCGGCLHKEAVQILVKHGLSSVIIPGTPINTISLVSVESTISFKHNHGRWIDRSILDNAIRTIAVQQGVTLINKKAKIIDSVAGLLLCNGQEQIFDLIIDCGGIATKSLPEWPEERLEKNGFGFQGYLKKIAGDPHGLDSLPCGEVRFLLDNFGYHGVVRVAGEEPYFHIASYLRGKKLHTSDFLKRYFLLEELHEKSATETLYRKRLPAQGKVFLCGDALGYPEPFTGEGMYFAIQTAERLAELITLNFQDRREISDISTKLWKKEIRILQKRQWARCQMITWIIESSIKRKFLFPLIPYIAPLASKLW